MIQRRFSFVVTLCLLTLSFTSYSQLPKTLLWRISGKDGHFLSYLYGTMHLSDDRVFMLGDSLYEAIRHSDGFAMEIDPGQMSAFVVEEVEKHFLTTKRLQDMLTEKEYKKYAPSLEKKLHRSAKDITAVDILREKNKYIQQSYQTGSMTTFLDVWLFDIARRQGKWTGGVEDLDDQRGIVDNLIDESDIREMALPDSQSDDLKDSAMNMLLRAYMDQDLATLESITADPRNGNLMIVKRNKKMAYRMDSLSAVRSMVFAVGAGHLAGDSGLIQLLRRRGFKVDPVISSTKIKASEYPVKEMPQAWTEVEGEDSLYHVSMPGKPSDLDLYGLTKMKMYFDVFNSTGYFTAGIRSWYISGAPDSALDQVGEKSFGTKNPKDYKPITINGAKGRVYAVQDEVGYKKGYLLLQNGVFYMAYGVATKMTETSKQQIDKFLGSLQIYEQKVEPIKDLGLLPFTDSLMGYRLMVPGVVKPFKLGGGQLKEGWASKLFFSQDLSGPAIYVFGAHSKEPGKYMDNDSAYFDDLRTRNRKLLDKVDYDSLWVDNGHYIFEISGHSAAAGMYMTMRYAGRGNRVYSLACTRMAEQVSEKTRHFFDSFTMLPYPEHSWRKTMSSDSLFTDWQPSTPTLYQYDSAKPGTTECWYVSNDSIRAQSCDILTYHLSPYNWQTTDSAFWKDRVDAQVGSNDTALYSQSVTNGDAQGWEIIKREQGSHSLLRLRMLMDGDKVIQLMQCVSAEELHLPDNDRFFSEFRLHSPAAPRGYRQSKAEQLLKDMFSGDSTTSANASAYLDKAPWQKSDLPLLHKAMFNRQPGDDGDDNDHYVVGNLVEELQKLHDTASFRFAAETYLSLPDSLRYLDRHLVNLMAGFEDSTHYAELFRILAKRPPTRVSFDLVYKLNDSLSLIKPLFSQWLPLFNDSVMLPTVAFLAVDLLDSNMLNAAALRPYEAAIDRFAEQRILVLKKTPTEDEVSRSDYRVIRLLGFLGGSRSTTLLNKYLHGEIRELQVSAIRELAHNNQPVDAMILRKLAADKTMRLSLYRALEKSKKTNLFPVAYHTQKAFAEGEIVQEMEEEYDDEPVDAVYTFVTVKSYPTENGPKLFYFFKVKTDETVRLACAGAYDQNPAHLNVKDATGFISEDEYDPKLLSQQMKSLFKSWKEYEKADKED